MNTLSSPASLEFLVKDFENRKLNFEQWKIQHSAAQGSEAYNTYVTQFRDYEAQMNKIIGEYKSVQPVQIGENLDAQLHSLLSKCKKEDFILAFLHASANDDTLLKTVKAALDSTSAPKNVPTLINSYGGRPNMPSSSSSPAMISISSPLLHAHGSPSIIPPSASSTINLRPKIQMTNYGAIPEGWVIDQPIIRPEKLPPPPKSYAEASKLPFFDIGGGK
uniref:Uncharacterized protein n=1 Tax=Panagrolaimus sp. ES5 TaxID=591445 RepID=A0AC34F277_9BILA